MTSIAYQPRILSQPGAKRYHRQTGTSTPQNTYQDIDLTVEHANPVVADSEGYFPVIYYDPSLPDYRVIHTDGSNVDDDPTLEVELEPTLDDIPSSSNVSSAYRVKGSDPTIIFEETDQPTNQKKWRLRAVTGLLILEYGNDAEDSWSAVFTFDRSGQINGGAVAISSTGSFTATLNGIDSTQTAGVQYVKTGRFVFAAINSVTGTSNATTCSLTGVPSDLRPTVSGHTVFVPKFMDNGSTVFDVTARTIVNSGTIQFLKAGSTTGFTASGDKGLSDGLTMIWAI
jgi:hypothetical protein